VPIKHNGVRVAVGLRVLAHGDWLSAAQGAPVFFSTEEAVCVETFVSPESMLCPRCKSEIVAGHAVVRCPDCGMIHHELADRNWWTYAPKCAQCSCPTALDTGLRWSPGGAMKIDIQAAAAGQSITVVGLATSEARLFRRLQELRA
jgi:hypothetical protein